MFGHMLTVCSSRSVDFRQKLLQFHWECLRILLTAWQTAKMATNTNCVQTDVPNKCLNIAKMKISACLPSNRTSLCSTACHHHQPSLQQTFLEATLIRTDYISHLEPVYVYQKLIYGIKGQFDDAKYLFLFYRMAEGFSSHTFQVVRVYIPIQICW